MPLMPLRPPPAAAWLLWTLVGAVPLLLPFSRSVELPVLVAALIALRALLRAPRDWLSTPPARAILLCCGAYTLAAAISALDAAAPQKTWTSVAASLRLGLYGLGLVWLWQHALAQGEHAHRLARGCLLAAALPLALWLADALLQALAGWSLGGPAEADRLSGIFGADNLKLGPLLPVLAPLLLWPLIGGDRRALLLVWLALLLVVLLAGARAGWISFALVSLLLAVRLAGGSRQRLLALLAGSALLALLAGIGSYQWSPTFQARVDRTLALAAGDPDHALAGRLWIWQASLAMGQAHPVNGVGIRSYRHAYPEHARPGDPWVDPQAGTGAAHAHHWVLELLTETGLIGLLLWLTAGWMLWRLYRRRRSDWPAQGAWAALFVLMFPVNTHLALYSTFMGVVLAWLLALAALDLARAEADSP